ncbi:hypothetical protein OSB04_009975 [Centaurea solstitialis]|uniref:Cupin type-2 domain-containing protein n=1 Tax=Centaurea solstitialis TaxID=347529 RepID=A0AA38TJT9_9ASTR|nr:hypothetical protein OSB04_009975 [Centaurea solstitialis]
MAQNHHRRLKIVAGADPFGCGLKDALVSHLQSIGIEVEDLGSDDYYSVGEKIGRIVSSASAVNNNSEETEIRGLLACGTGVGVAIFANKFPGVYAATCLTPDDAVNARSINNCNVIAVAGGGSTTLESAIEILGVGNPSETKAIGNPLVICRPEKSGGGRLRPLPLGTMNITSQWRRGRDPHRKMVLPEIDADDDGVLGKFLNTPFKSPCPASKSEPWPEEIQTFFDNSLTEMAKIGTTTTPAISSTSCSICDLSAGRDFSPVAIMPGGSMKIVRESPTSAIVRFTAGSIEPAHHHTHGHDILVMKGRKTVWNLTKGERFELGVGDFLFTASGDVHRVRYLEDTEFFIRWDGTWDIQLDEDLATAAANLEKET